MHSALGSFSNKFSFSLKHCMNPNILFCECPLIFSFPTGTTFWGILLFIIAIVQCSLGQGKQFSSLNQSLFAGMAECGWTHPSHIQIRVTAAVCFRQSHWLWLLLWLLLWHFTLKKSWLDGLLRDILSVSFFFKFNTILNINPSILVMWNY